VKIAGLVQYIVDARPVDSQEHNIGIARRISRRTGARAVMGLASEAFELLLAARVAEHDFMAGTCQDGAELTAHETRAEYADPHVASRPMGAAAAPSRRAGKARSAFARA
jgi:hypothetical protein